MDWALVIACAAIVSCAIWACATLEIDVTQHKLVGAMRLWFPVAIALGAAMGGGTCALLLIFMAEFFKSDTQCMLLTTALSCLGIIIFSLRVAYRVLKHEYLEAEDITHASRGQR